jgi:ABC transporter DrrB family efflux protein
MPAAVSDTLVLAKRNLLRLPRNPDLLVSFTVQPLMFVLLFNYVFGGAITTPGIDYTNFLMPGIIVQTMSFGGFVTAIGLVEDLNKGLIDRFRSLPMSRGAVLAGRTVSDLVPNAVSLTIMIGVGLLIGFSFSTPFTHVLAGIVLMFLFGFAFSWIFAWMGLIASSAESAQAFGFMAIFPLTFISSAFVPTDTLPSVLQAFAEVNPFTTVVDAVRHLWVGTPAHSDVWAAFAWSLGLIAVFSALAIRRYRLAVGR